MACWININSIKLDTNARDFVLKVACKVAQQVFQGSKPPSPPTAYLLLSVICHDRGIPSSTPVISTWDMLLLVFFKTHPDCLFCTSAVGYVWPMVLIRLDRSA